MNALGFEFVKLRARIAGLEAERDKLKLRYPTEGERREPYSDEICTAISELEARYDIELASIEYVWQLADVIEQRDKELAAIRDYENDIDKLVEGEHG
jgi:hypothetical protein